MHACTQPRDKKTVRAGAFNPVLRELVFDIDMTDYDPIRTCCSNADICKKCWAFIAAAVQVLDSAIRDEFGYEKLLWVYSGRRGIHLWISDKEAMALSDQQRKVLVSWLTIIHGGKESSKKLNLHYGGKLPPSLQFVSLLQKSGQCTEHAFIRHALNYLKTAFVDLILRNQKCFDTEEGYEELLKALPDSRIVETLRTKWEADPSRSSEDKWLDLLSHKASKVLFIYFCFKYLQFKMLIKLKGYGHCHRGYNSSVHIPPARC